MAGSHVLDLGQFVAGAATQQRRPRPGRRHAVVDDPRPRLDAGAAQVGLQVGGFEHRRGLGQGDDQHLGPLRVLELHHRRGEVGGAAAHLAHDLPVIGAGGVEQQQGVAGGRGVHHHKLAPRLADDPGEGLEDGDLLGAGRTQVFFQQRPALGVELGALGIEHMLAVARRLGGRVDAADGELIERAFQRLGQVGGRVGGGEMHRQAAPGKLHRHRRGEGRLAHAALAHQHHQPVAVGGDAVHQPGDVRQGGRRDGRHVVGRADVCRHEELAQRVQPHQVEGLEGDPVGGQAGQPGGHRGEGRLLAGEDRCGERVALRLARRQEAVDDQKLPVDADGGQLVVGARHFAQGGLLGAGHQHQPGARAVGQRFHRRLVLAALLFQPGQRAQAGRVALARLEKAAPRAGQLQQADGVAGGRGVEDDVLVVVGQAGIHQQPGEFVEGGDLGGAGAGELLLDALHHAVGQEPAHRPDDAVAVSLGGGLRVDLEGGEMGHRGDRRDPVADLHAKHLPHVGGRVGAHQQHAPAAGGKVDGGGAGDGGLAHPALAGEEHKARQRLDELHGGLRAQQHLLPLQQGLGASGAASPSATPSQRATSARAG